MRRDGGGAILGVVPIETSFESERWFTAAEFAEWVDSRTSDLERVELLNGRIVMNPPGGWPQGEVALTVAALLRAFVVDRGLGRVFGSDQGFELPSGDVVSPDAAYVSAERWSGSGPHEFGRFLRVVPEIAIEVLSPSTASRDRGEKKAIYERNGVAEYWLIDVAARRVTRFDLRDGTYAAPVVFEGESGFESALLPGLRLELAAVFS